jgi:hypothetical protein
MFSRTWYSYFQQLYDRVGGVAADLVRLAEFTGRNQSLDEVGYQVFPGGLTRQWGTATTDVSGRVEITFPMKFKTRCVSLQCEETDVTEASGITFAHGSLAPDQVEVYSSGAGTTSAAKRFSWEALGY